MILSAVREWVPALTLGADVGKLAWLKGISVFSAVIKYLQISPGAHLGSLQPCFAKIWADVRCTSGACGQSAWECNSLRQILQQAMALAFPVKSHSRSTHPLAPNSEISCSFSGNDRSCHR